MCARDASFGTTPARPTPGPRRPSPLRRGAFALLACALAAPLARADDAPPPAPPALVPPRALDTPPVPPPARADEDVVVVLELLVGIDGEVREVKVISGRAPFAGAAADAARRWRYAPARRGDANVAARIRTRVEFHAARPAPPTEGAPSANASSPGASAPRAPQELDEVSVYGARAEAGRTTMSGGEVRQMPGAFGDAFRALDALPGVTPIVSGIPYFFVRGAPPANTGYFIDGIRVPLLFHFAFGPSVIHPGLVDRVDYYPGGYPARFGRFAGGIVAGETLSPARTLHGEANVRLFDAGALVESPFEGGRGTALAAGRYGYPGLLLPLVAPNTGLSYWDYQTRATWDLGPRDRIGAFVFGSYDDLSSRDDAHSPYKQIAATQFHRVDLRYDHLVGAHGRVRLAATFGVDRSGDDNTGTAYDTSFGVRMEYDDRPSDALLVHGGADVLLDRYTIDTAVDPSGGAATRALFPARNDVVIGAHADAAWRLTPRVELVPGLRADIFTTRHIHDASPLDPPIDRQSAAARVGVDPRLAARVTLTPRVVLASTFGVSHQPATFFVPIPGLQLGQRDPQLQTSFQMSQGIELRLPLEITATPTVFLHDYLGMSDLTATCLSNNLDLTSSPCEDQRVRGRAYGFELLVRRPLTKRISGWLSYTLSRTTREAHPPFSSDTVQDVLSEFDRTHVLSAVGAIDLGAHWRFGARFMYYTGRPYTPQIDGIYVPPVNAMRMPDFWRIDARLEKRWQIFGTGTIALVFEGMNVTANKEAVDMSCSAFTTPTCKPQYVGPVAIPSVGVEGSY